jgi:hypothetical protein
MWRLLYRRPDGSFLIETENNWPYHVVPDDPLFTEVAKAALKVDVPLEPAPVEEVVTEPPPPSPPPVPRVISRRQLLIALTQAGLITEAEALAAAQTGAVPEAIDGFFATLPSAQQIAARITWATMTQVERHHPLVQGVINAQLATAEQVDALFTAAAAL